MSMCRKQTSTRKVFRPRVPSWEYSRRAQSASGKAQLSFHKLRDGCGEFGGLFERHHVRAARDDTDFRFRNSFLEFVRLNHRHELFLLAPNDLAWRGASMQ